MMVPDLLILQLLIQPSQHKRITAQHQHDVSGGGGVVGENQAPNASLPVPYIARRALRVGTPRFMEGSLGGGLRDGEEWLGGWAAWLFALFSVLFSFKFSFLFLLSFSFFLRRFEEHLGVGVVGMWEDL